MCSYKESKAEPTELMRLDGFTVDYAEMDEGGIGFESPSRLHIDHNYGFRA